jgi:hypothetical protein
VERRALGNPSKRINKNPHVTPQCHGCLYENTSDPTERPCYLCVRKELSIDPELCTKELMHHYKEYFEENKREYHDYYVDDSDGKGRRKKEEWLRLGN